MQATELIAGRALDALIAEKVMQLRVSQSTATHLVSGYDDPEGWGDSDSVWEPVPLYSTDITAAWQVAEKFEDGGVAIVRAFAVARDSRPPIDGTGGRWQAQIWTDRSEHAQYVAYADTASLAICRAALATADH